MKVYFYEVTLQRLEEEEEENPMLVFDLTMNDLLECHYVEEFAHRFQNGYHPPTLFLNFYQSNWYDEVNNPWCHRAISMKRLKGEGVRLIWKHKKQEIPFDTLFQDIGDAPWANFIHSFLQCPIQMG